jgi:prevent-host-death family protein
MQAKVSRMIVVNMHEAKTNLSRLIEAALKAGEPFTIARAGKPVATVTPISPPPKLSRLGFMKGQFKAPDDFDAMMGDDIAQMFEGKP